MRIIHTDIYGTVATDILHVAEIQSDNIPRDTARYLILNDVNSRFFIDFSLQNAHSYSNDNIIRHLLFISVIDDLCNQIDPYHCWREDIFKSLTVVLVVRFLLNINEGNIAHI